MTATVPTTTDSPEATGTGATEQEPCPNCECCTAKLCAKGRTSVFECVGLSNPEAKLVVRDCPCSSPLTPGTAAHAAALLRARQHATERPMTGTAELALRCVASSAEGAADEVGHEDARLLRTWRYVVADGLGLALTEAGRAYLDARDGTDRGEAS